jgi:integrase
MRCGVAAAAGWPATVKLLVHQLCATVRERRIARRSRFDRNNVPLLQKVRHLRGPRVLRREDGHEKLARPLLRKWLSRVQRKASLRDNGGLHIMRHTFCSHLAMQGVPVNAIKELAGHQDIMTTMRYMHLSPAAKDTAVQALDNRDAALKKQQDAAAPAENA